MPNQDNNTAIRLALMRQLFAASRASLVTNIVLAAILSYLLKGVVSHALLMPWLALIVLLALLRRGLVVAYLRQEQRSDEDSLKWLAGYRLLVVLAGLTWGSSSFLLFPPDSETHQLLLMVIMAGLSAGSTTSFASDKFCAIAFLSATLLPAIASLFVHGLGGMGAAGVLYLGYMTMSSLRITGNMHENILLQIEARRNEKAIRASEERYHLLLNHSPVGIFHYSPQFKLTYCNERFADIMGVAVEFLMGLDMQQFRGKPTFPVLANALQGESGSFEGPCPASLKEDGVWIELHCAPMRDADGQVVGGIGIVQDIGKRKEAEAMVLRAKEKAEALAQSKADFLANMSHEIRTPMNAILGLSQLALDKESQPEIRDYLEKIHLSAEGLLGILNDILDFSKMEAGKLGIENAAFDLHALLETLSNLFAFRAEEKRLELRIEIASDLPEVMVGDALRLRQVLSNLLSNAIKFTEQGRVVMQVHLLGRMDTHVLIRFSVSDTGIGISPEDRSKLFQPFSQADASITRRFGGTGLGLVISQRLLQLMGGELHVESTHGVGSTFSFDLQLDVPFPDLAVIPDVQNVGRKAGTLKEEIRLLAGHLQGARILLAEDNAINQRVVLEILKLAGATAEVANNGREALQLLDNDRYDAVLMDVQMPEMGGLEATLQIRRQPQHQMLPIIALTAGVAGEDRDKCLEGGMNDFLTKPVSPKEMVKVLNSWIGKNR